MTANEVPAATDPIEHRLALVMNGGVSLAVWMGGVAREIDNARRASNGIPLPADATATQKRVHELWAAATRDAAARVTVDVIAGTSAGGLNGLLLAAAIARGAPLSQLKGLWMDAGQMSATALFTPQPGAEQSLMNGDFFHERIAHALSGMLPAAEEDRRDVSLIVTATALGASSRPVTDTSGRRFQEPDHRRRYHFTRHAARPTYVAADDTYRFDHGVAADHFAADEPLATSGRATASFPAAFAPVRETPLLRERRVWPNWQTTDQADWLADGGILDNSPFDPVLESIAHKPVTGPWRRTLCFIEPAADEVALGLAHPEPGGDDTDQLPPPWTSVVLSAFNFPGEIDFRDDIEQLHTAIRSGRSSLDVTRFRSLTEGSAAANTLAEAFAICGPAIALYRQSTVVAAIYSVRDVIVRSRPDGYLDPATSVKDLALVPSDHDWLPNSFPDAADPLPPTWEWGTDAADRVLRTLLRATSPGPGNSTPADAAALRRELSTRLDQVTAIRRAVESDLGQTPETASLADAAIVTLLDGTYSKLAVARQLAPIIAAAVTEYATAWLNGAVSPPHVLAAALAVEVSNGAGSQPDYRPRPLFDFDRLGLDNPPPLLVDAYESAFAVAPTSSAPHPAAPPRNNILYGSRLSHFAAFADPDWRNWDWMWGRLNALTHLAALLDLPGAAVDRLTEAILLDEGWDVDRVNAHIPIVVGLDFHTLEQHLLDTDRIPPIADALLAFLRSDPATKPKLPRLLVDVGQILSDALARKGQAGSVRHRFLRLAAWPVRRELWRRITAKR